MKNTQETKCLVCGWLAVIINEPKYSGFRGYCKKCENNWPES